MIETSKLPPIPMTEWAILAIGLVLFSITEVALFLNGYTNILLNSIASLIIASSINFGVFVVKDKVKRIASALKRVVMAVWSIIVFVLDVLDSIVHWIPQAVIWLAKAIPRLIVWLVKAIPRLVLWLVKAIPAFIKVLIEFLPALVLLIGIILLNLLMIPVLAIYLTIYGIVLSLSGGANKIMLKHYDAFGHRMMAPIEEYIYYDAIVMFVVFFMLIVIGGLIISDFQTASSVSSVLAYNASIGDTASLSTTITAYSAVFAIALGIAAVALLIRFFRSGAGAFAMS